MVLRRRLQTTSVVTREDPTVDKAEIEQVENRPESETDLLEDNYEFHSRRPLA